MCILNVNWLQVIGKVDLSDDFIKQCGFSIKEYDERKSIERNAKCISF